MGPYYEALAEGLSRSIFHYLWYVIWGQYYTPVTDFTCKFDGKVQPLTDVKPCPLPRTITNEEFMEKYNLRDEEYGEIK